MNSKYVSTFLGLVFLFTIASFSDAVAPSDKKLQKKAQCISPQAADVFLDKKQERALEQRATTDPAGVASNGNIVILQANQLLEVANPFDLKGRTVHFHPAPNGRYVYTVDHYSFNSQASETLSLADDDALEIDIGFMFPFAGKQYSRLFINSNGNLTFERADVDPPVTETIFDGPPRIAAFFADLDPQASGTVFVYKTSDFLAVSWLKVPEFFNQDQFAYGENTFQAVLFKSGRIDLIYSNEITATEGFTGILPGAGYKSARLVDFSRQFSAGRPSRSYLENFHKYESIDIPSVTKAIYASYPDDFDFITLLSNFDLTPIPGAQAFAINVQNDAKGIGNPSSKARPVFKETKKYGSKSKLQNITFLGNIHQYPRSLSAKLQDTETSIMQILAHEIGHRWLSYIKLSRDGQSTTNLLGRDRSHWNFFLDTDGSFVEGNQIVPLSGNAFATRSPFQRFSSLDLYLMGLMPPESVPDLNLIEGASDFSPEFGFTAESSPESNVSFKGSAVPVRIADIVAANGPRIPDHKASQKEFRHLFVLITKQDKAATTEELQYCETLRQEWERFFSGATGNRATVKTNVE